MSACPRAYLSIKHASKLHEIFCLHVSCMLPAPVVALSSSDGNAIRYVFPVLWMTYHIFTNFVRFVSTLLYIVGILLLSGVLHMNTKTRSTSLTVCCHARRQKVPTFTDAAADKISSARRRRLQYRRHRRTNNVGEGLYIRSSLGSRSAFISKRQRITLRLLYAMSRPSVVCLSVVCDVGAPYSGG